MKPSARRSLALAALRDNRRRLECVGKRFEGSGGRPYVEIIRCFCVAVCARLPTALAGHPGHSLVVESGWMGD
ncbi:hypothetical protein KCP78_18770 [Salmonella enterica subsp. enterica]|nr:hypothetical protein KCP78_18770 [Salmonella enterica subsp. enterica]